MPMAPVSNGQIYYEEQSKGGHANELVILLPGLGHDHTYFAKTLPLIARVGRVVTPDPRGLGLSSPADSYSVEQWAADVLELIAHLGAPRAHLVGSSLGACVCMQAALDDPARVASLTLVAGFSEVDPLLEMNFRTRLKILDEVGLGDVMASHVSMWTLGRTYLATAEAARKWKNCLLRCARIRRRVIARSFRRYCALAAANRIRQVCPSSPRGWVRYARQRG